MNTIMCFFHFFVFHGTNSNFNSIKLLAFANELTVTTSCVCGMSKSIYGIQDTQQKYFNCKIISGCVGDQ